MLELAMISPWILMLFIGVLDWGFYAYALISVQSAARSAALYTSKSVATSSDSSTACTIVAAELASLPNSDSACSTNNTVTAAAITGPDGGTATQVTVTYDTLSIIPIPGVLKNKFRITRIVTMHTRT